MINTLLRLVYVACASACVVSVNQALHGRENKQVSNQISAKKKHIASPLETPHILVRPLTSIGLILTLPKFHLAPLTAKM